MEPTPTTIFFEWSDVEENISREHGINWPVARFERGNFDVELAMGFQTVSIFVDSRVTDDELKRLADSGLKVIAVRAAGTDMLNIELAKEFGVTVYRVANYSPESVAEHVFALLLSIMRRLPAAREMHREGDNVRNAELLGRTLRGKTIGLYGAGRIGSLISEIAIGFGMRVVFYDKFVGELVGAQNVGSLDELFAQSDVVSVQVPLTEETKYSVNAGVLSKAKRGLFLINVGRGDVVDAESVLAALDSGQLGGLGIDVWDTGIVDDKFDPRLLRQNVFQTNHIAFFTYEAVISILNQTAANLSGNPLPGNLVTGGQ